MNDASLRQKQSLPLAAKVALTESRIREWVDHWAGQVYVAFSGGKDSTVLMHIARRMYPEIPAVFIDTGLEYPELRDFVKGFDGVEWIRPKKLFADVVREYGYPVVSKEIAQHIYEIRRTKSEKLLARRLSDDIYMSGRLPVKWRYLLDAPFPVSHKCCEWLKKEPARRYEKATGRKPLLGTMASESTLRKQRYLRYGCNGFDMKRPASTPMAFWLEEDVWEYIKKENVAIAKIYEMGYERTGCMFCAFGYQYDGDNDRFERMRTTHPAQYKYCMNTLGMREVLGYIKKANCNSAYGRKEEP